MPKQKITCHFKREYKLEIFKCLKTKLSIAVRFLFVYSTHSQDNEFLIMANIL